MKRITFLKSLFLLFVLIVGNLSAWAEDVNDALTVKGWASYTGTCETNGTDHEGTSATTGVKYVMQAYNGSSGQVRGNQTNDYANFSCRNSTTYAGYYIKKVVLKLESGTGTLDGSTSGRSVVYFGSSAFASPKTADPSGTAVNSKENASGRTTLTWENSSEDASYFIIYNTKTSGTTASAKVIVTWAKKKTLSSISLSGTYPTNFVEGDEFSHEGMTVTAVYDDDSEKDVTSSATFTGYDMSTSGAQTVTVGYEENSVTKTTTYNINVAPASSPNATLSETSLAFGDIEVGQTKELTFTVTPANLTGDLTISCNNDKYSVLPTSIAQATTTATTITVTAAPTARDDDMDGEITISGGGITPKTVTLSATPYVAATVSLVADPAGAGTFTYNEATVTSIDSKVGSSATITAVAEDGYIFTGWTATGATPELSENAEQEFSFTDATPVLTATFEVDNSITYDFSQIEGFSDWGTSYTSHTVTYTDAVVGFTNHNHQTGTITDIPVSKGADVTLVLRNEGETLKSAKFVCRQWGTKAQTITLYYSTDGGKNYSTLSPSVTSTNFTIESNNLPVGTNAVKIGFSSSDNQVGVESATIEINRVVAATITSAEYATFVSIEALDFSETGIKVYTATDNETSVKLNEITSGEVPANTPVVLYKAAGGTVYVPVIASADGVGANDLRVSTGSDVENMFVLAKKNNKVGFYKWAGSSDLSAGKVYLLGQTTSSSRAFLGFDANTTTAIDNVVIKPIDDNAPMYNLAGQRVNKSYKGVVIVNGKKVVRK